MAAAYRLKQRGFAVTVFESRNRVGGRMWSIKKGDFLMDVGMSAYLGTYREAIKLIAEVGLGPEMSDLPAIGATMRDGQRHHLDYSRPVATALSTKLLSWPAKIRAIKLVQDTFRNRASLGYSDYTKLADIDVETVAEYCARTLNDELRHYAAQPLVSGTWVADDADTSVALLFWTIRNMLAPSVYNLNGGVMALPVELAKHVEVRFETAIDNVADNGAGVDVTGDGRTERFDGCVIATTAEPALAMFPQMDANTRGLYETTRYRKLGNICIGLSRRPADRATYYLPCPHEDRDTIAVIADHVKAPCRAPEGKGLLTVLLSHEYLERSVNLATTTCSITRSIAPGITTPMSRLATCWNRTWCAGLNRSRQSTRAVSSASPIMLQTPTVRRVFSSRRTSIAFPAATARWSAVRKPPRDLPLLWDHRRLAVPYFLILAEDRGDGLDDRLAHRQEHIDYWNAQTGVVKVAGAMLGGDRPNGSVLLIEAQDEPAARALLERDPFTREGVFSGQNQVIAMRPAIGDWFPAR